MLWHKVQGAGGTGGGGAWDISTASYSQNFSIATEETFPLCIFFKPDGTKMYIGGSAGSDINEYNLSIAWDVSTASYVQNFSVSSQDLTPIGLSFKSDGTRMYVLGGSDDDVNEYSLSTAWDISTASYVQNFSVATDTASPFDLFFKPDGTKMYIVDNIPDEINEYSLSTAWNISTASYVQNFSVATEDTSPVGLAFKPDGTRMYVLGLSGLDVNQYNLSTVWDISTASYVQSFSVSSQETNPRAIAFNGDGTKMYIIGPSGDDVNEYNLG